MLYVNISKLLFTYTLRKQGISDPSIFICMLIPAFLNIGVGYILQYVLLTLNK